MGHPSFNLKPDGTRGNKYTLGIKLARFRPDGHLDVSFGSGGKVSTDSLRNERVFAMTLQGDEKIVVVNSCYPLQPVPTDPHNPHFRMLCIAA